MARGRSQPIRNAATKTPATIIANNKQQEEAKTARPRSARNAANKASAKITAAAQQETKADVPKGLKADLLDEAMTPLRDEHREDCKAWVEIESEPAFFNGTLRNLGVQDVKVVEVFTVDPNDVDMVHMLPFVPLVTLGKQSFCINRYNARQPILGFVFLSKYVAEDQDHIVEAPPSLWFANQTMANGCATLALLNILLNKPSVQLGASLTEFKAGTAPLAPFLRGFLLDSNTSLREVHNAHARRLEHLNSDLLVSNEYEDANGWIDSEDDEAAQKKKEAQEKKRAAASKKRARKPSASTASKKKRLTGDDTCHYKAFVFAESQVWVLDGLSEKPISLGPADEHNWVYLALSAIQAKMLDAGDMVNVLAVCQSPTVALRAELLTNIRTLFSLRDALHGAARPAKKPGRLYLDENDDLDDAALSKYGTTRAALDAVRPDEDILANMGDDEASKIALVATLETEQARIQGEYMEEMRDVAREEERCDGRKRDYGQLMHRWVKKIAERGDLQGLVG